MQDKIDALTKIKDEQIEKLTKIKDVLKTKLDEAKKENADLNKQIEELRSRIDDVQKNPQKSEAVPKIEEILKEHGKKMDFILKQVENLISIVVTKPTITTSESVNVMKEKTERKITRNIEKIASQTETPIKESKIIMEPAPKLEDVNKTSEDHEEVEAVKQTSTTESNMMALQYPEDGVIRCPKCNRQKWKEMRNKSRMISPGVFSKYYYCMTCRTTWEYMY